MAESPFTVHLQRSPATKTCQRANCQQEHPAAPVAQAAQEDQAAQADPEDHRTATAHLTTTQLALH